MTTTSYGTWNNRADKYSLTVEQTVEERFGTEGPGGFDLAAIVRDYSDAINDALPPSVTLSGNEFIGAAHVDHETGFAGYPLDEFMQLDIAAIVDGIDLWDIITRHEQ